jgi:predicted nucleic acid-binding protein
MVAQGEPAEALDPYIVYVDTNVVHYLSTGRWPPQQNTQGARATASLNEINNLAQAGRILCTTSTLTLAEEYDNEKGAAIVRREMRNGNAQRTNSGISIRRRPVSPLDPRARANSLRAFIAGLGGGIVRLDDPDSWPANMVEMLCRTTDLQWADATHLALALASRCDFFITNDEAFAREVIDGLQNSRRILHRRVAAILQNDFGLPPERTRPPVIRVLWLSDENTAPSLAALH